MVINSRPVRASTFLISGSPSLLAPFGEFPNFLNGKKLIQVLDEETAGKMVDRWEADGRKPLLIDFDHRSLERKDDTQAAGWIQNLSVMDGGLYADIKWSDSGRKAIEGGNYLYLSPVWYATFEGDKAYPGVLKGAGLTNLPNLPLPPLANREHPDTLTKAARRDGTSQHDLAIRSLVDDLFMKQKVRTGTKKNLYDRLWRVKYSGSADDLNEFNGFFLLDGTQVKYCDLFGEGKSSFQNSTLTESAKNEGTTVTDTYLKGLVDSLAAKSLIKRGSKEDVYRRLHEIKHSGSPDQLHLFCEYHLKPGVKIKYRNLRPGDTLF